MEVKIKKIDPRAETPVYAHAGDACFDMKILIDNVRNRPRVYDKEAGEFINVPVGPNNCIVLRPQQTMVFNTGLSFEFPEGYVMKIHARSSLGVKRSLALGCSGIIDSGYRGNVSISLVNVGDTLEVLTDGDRVAQGEIAAVEHAEFNVVEELSASERGTGGIGSTGR